MNSGFSDYVAQDVPLPELPQYYPELYVDDEFFAKAREQMYILDEEDRVSGCAFDCYGPVCTRFLT